jgi:hypothetical protein
MSYDDEAELTRYFLRHHPSLLSPFEERVRRAAYAREKFANDTGEHGRRVMERYGRLGDPRIDAALAVGIEKFLRSACRRILAEHTELRINRCPRCERVLRAPAAMQCFWCGYDWHGKCG